MTFNDHAIPRKTAAGAVEIRQRSRGLPARLRTVLLLVDGIKPLSELNAMLSSKQDVSAALQSLQDMGLLEVIELQQPDQPPDQQPPAAEAEQAVLPALSRRTDARAATPASPGAARQSASAPGRSGAAPRQPAPALGELTADQQILQRRQALLLTRAHLANALDELLGHDGYLLRQQVAACTSKSELEALYGAIHSSLSAVADEAQAAAILRHAAALLDATPAGVKP
ncbi:MAG: hypothetical protein ACRYGK_18410 [Janthinobacterium lividum]